MKKMLFFLLFIVILIIPYSGFAQVTWTSTGVNGLWNNAATWTVTGGGATTPGITIASGNSVFVNHTVTYNEAGDLTINSGALLKIQDDTLKTIAIDGRSIMNYGTTEIRNAALVIPMFQTDGTTPANGSFENKTGGAVIVRDAYIEIAEDWAADEGSTRSFIRGCLYTGQNYSNNKSDDVLEEVCVVVANH